MTSINDKKEKTIGLLPYELDANGYIKKNRKILGKIGKVVPVPRPKPLLAKTLKKLMTTGNCRLYDVLIVNWRENTLKNGHNNLHFRGILEYFLSLLLHRAVTKKLVYVKHNSQPHNLSRSSSRTARTLVRAGQVLANTIVIHSPVCDSEITKAMYVPHPLYAIEPQKSPYDSSKPGEVQFIMIGRVQPYKKIDEVIALWKGSSRLVVLGPCSDNRYLMRLKELAKDKNVEFQIGFHEESYLARRITDSNGVIIANENDSMLVSGSFFFAISCGSPVYATSSPFFEWIKTTKLSDFVSVHDGIDCLVDSASKNLSLLPDTKKKIICEANTLFGDQLVETKWRQAINKN